MNTLLIFFAFPIAVIIISAILQKLLNNPISIAALIFAIFIIVTFAAFDETFLIATLAYTILAFITAFLVSRFCNSNNNENSLCERLREILENNNSENTENVTDALQDILQNNNDNNTATSCGCGGRNFYRKRYRHF